MQRMLEVKRFIFGPFETNTYVVSGLGSHILLIDPACSNDYEQQQLLQYINALPFTGEELCSIGLPMAVRRTLAGVGLTIIATHGHLDHLWGAKWATERWDTRVLMHEADIPMAQAMQEQYNLFGIRAKANPFPLERIDRRLCLLTEYRPQAAPADRIQIIETPGHTPGSVCLYFPEEKILFSGDTLFQMGYGRTDLPGGNYGRLLDSLEHLFSLPPDVRVYPGHGEQTTIGREKR